VKLSCVSRFGAVALCSSAALLSGCSGASSPRNVAGVRAMYRSVGLDAGAGDFPDICRSYMGEPLRGEVKRTNNNCSTSSSLSNLERWAEKVRLSKVGPRTRIVMAGDDALVYDGVKPEKALYLAGQWRLIEVPELTAPRHSR
jgi:hypothetical protein